jgi:DNA-binding helix-hairpin-helix protein with protein kinase domain
MPMVVLDSSPPRRVWLGPVLGRGGEAVVHAAGPELAVKVFRCPPDDLARRLEGMVALLEAAAHPELAWPTALARDAGDGRVLGYAMRSVGGPALGTRFGRRGAGAVAHTLAGHVAALHARGLVLGDVSPNNIVVGRAGRLTFLDCDSMQFVAPGTGERFACRMQTPEYAAPELQREPLAAFTTASDCYALALLVLRLLREFPPGVLELSRRTFGEGRELPAARPSAAEWRDALAAAPRPRRWRARRAVPSRN